MFLVNKPHFKGFPDNLIAIIFGHIETILTFSWRSNETNALSFLAQLWLEVSMCTKGACVDWYSTHFSSFHRPSALEYRGTT